MKYPKSLTATIHIVFHENGAQVRAGNSEVELISRIMTQASEMDREMQELLVKFATFLRKLSKEDGQDPLS